MTPRPAEKPPLIDVSTSVPLPAHSAQRPVKTYAERMARVDGCPSCVINYALPSIVRDTLEGFVAHYTCTDCGHDWLTSWED